MKKNIIALSTVGLIIAGLSTPKLANAFWPFSNNSDQQQAEQTETQRPFQELITRLVEKFGLNQTEVEEVFDTFHQERREERQQEREQNFESRLDQAVENGELTEEQKQLILEKHEENMLERESLLDLSPEERRETAQEHREEMETWAEENGIDLPFNGMMGKGGKGGMRGGRGM